MLKDNKRLLVEVKALEENQAELKEEQGWMQLHMERLGSEKLAETE